MAATTTPGTGAKECFDDLYVQPDPRAYFSGLGALGYEVPSHGEKVFAPVLGAMDVSRPKVVDLCCSYGINAALLTHDITLDELFTRYTDDALSRASSDEVLERDRAFFAERRGHRDVRVVGLDAAAPAVDYAVRVGLLDAGFAEDLETDDPSDPLSTHIDGADLLTVTGGIGYITATTFDRLLGCMQRREPPWVAALCLRTVPYQPVAECLAGYGLVTEQLTGVTFPQRRFADPTERDYALGELDALGVDPAGKEADGRYHVNVYLSRPQSAVDENPVRSLLGHLTT